MLLLRNTEEQSKAVLSHANAALLGGSNQGIGGKCTEQEMWNQTSLPVPTLSTVKGMKGWGCADPFCRRERQG